MISKLFRLLVANGRKGLLGQGVFGLGLRILGLVLGNACYTKKSLHSVGETVPTRPA